MGCRIPTFPTYGRLQSKKHKTMHTRFAFRWCTTTASLLALFASPVTPTTRSEEFRLPIPQLAGGYAYGKSRGPVPFDLGSSLSTVVVIRVEVAGTFSLGWWDGDDVEDSYHGPRGSSLYFEMNGDAAYPHRWGASVGLATNGSFSQTITLRRSGGGTDWDFLRDGTSDLHVHHSLIYGWGGMTIPPQVTITSLTVSIEAERAPDRLAIRVSQVELCWPTALDAWYQLQYRSILTTNHWVPLTAWLRGDGDLFRTNDAVLIGQAQRFYQVARTNAPPP